MCGHKVSRDEIRFRKRSTTYPHFHKNYYTFQEEKYYEYCVKFWVVNLRVYLGINYILGFKVLVFHVLGIVHCAAKEIAMPVWK